MPLVHLMVKVGFAASNSEAARLIQGGGVQIDQVKISDPQLKLELKTGTHFVLKVGKKKYIKVMVGGGTQ
jgi:tyrosyl-tRNA synthetase